MMLRHVRLPSSYCKLLSTSLTGETVDGLRSSIQSNSNLVHLFQYAHNMKGPFDEIFKSLGWVGVRNRLAYTYLHYYKHKYFAKHWGNLNLIKDILTFEEDMSLFTTEANSKCFLVGFYAMMSNQIDIIKRPEILELFKNYLHVRLVNFDFTYLLILYLYQVLGRDLLGKLLDKRTSYITIYQKYLSAKNQEELILNLLNYSASIDNTELFAHQVD